MRTKEELKQGLLFFTPTITYDRTASGIALQLEVDVFNNHFNWMVKEGDHYTDFLEDFNAACEYYLKAIGNETLV